MLSISEGHVVVNNKTNNPIVFQRSLRPNKTIAHSLRSAKTKTVAPIVNEEMVFDTRTLDEDELNFILHMDSDNPDDGLQDLSEESSGFL